MFLALESDLEIIKPLEKTGFWKTIQDVFFAPLISLFLSYFINLDVLLCCSRVSLPVSPPFFGNMMFVLFSIFKVPHIELRSTKVAPTIQVG